MGRNAGLLLSVPILLGFLSLPGRIGAASSLSLEDDTQEIARLLRCPVCQNLSVADSPSELAVQMREVIRDRLRQGESREQIMAYFVEKYGEWILLSPARHGFNWLAWIAPFAGLLGGLGAMGGLLYRWRRSSTRVSPADVDPAYHEQLRRELREEGESPP